MKQLHGSAVGPGGAPRNLSRAKQELPGRPAFWRRWWRGRLHRQNRRWSPLLATRERLLKGVKFDGQCVKLVG
jgi:hypothetical protein